MANKLVNVNGKFVMQRDTPTSPSRLGPTKIKEALNKTAQQKKAAQSSGSVPYASPIAKNVKIDTSPRNYGKPVADKVQIVDYQSPIDTSPRNYGRPLTNKLHLGLYDDEKSLSNVTLGDVTYKPVLSGYYGQKMNEAIGVNRLSGNTNMNTPQIAKYQGLAQKYEPTRFSNPNAPFGGLLNNAPQGAMSLIGQQVANLTDEDTVMYAGTGAAAGAMIGSVAGLPGSAISAASGLKAGIAAGVGKNMFEAVYGGTYRDLMDAGVSDSTAHKTALISAGVQSALEMAQLDELAKAAKLLRKQNKTVLAEGIEKILIDRGKGVLKNTAEEMAQEVVAISGEHYAKSKEGLPTDSLEDNVKRTVETGLNSALSMGLISLPGAVYTGNQSLQYDKDQKRAQEYIDSLKVAMIKNGITPRPEQPQSTLVAQAANQTLLNNTWITPQDLGNAAIADVKNNWTPGQVRYQNNLYMPPGREKTMTAERRERSRQQAIQYAKRANIDIVFRDLEEGEGHFEGKFEQYDGKNITNPKGRITINNNSYDPFRVVFIHEFTHAMELSKDHYNKYANFAIVNLLPYKYGTNDIAELADAKAKYYASQGVRLTPEEARQEIVSELTSEYMFRDYQAIENLFRYNENIFYWMFENIKNWVKSFSNTQEERDLVTAYKLYAKVLKEHQKRPNVVEATQEDDAQSDNNNVANAAQEGDTQVAASYLFAGERATNADKEALAKAQQMESDNADAETIWKETGWIKGPDKKWRWEIDDSKGEYYQGNAEPLTRLKAEKERYDELFDKLWNSELTKDEEQEMESLWELLKENDIDPKETGTMGDFYKNDDMYAAYPNLKYVGVRNEKMDPNGMYIPDEDTIAISKDITDLGNKDRNKSVLLHETQHAIQRREGFSKGGNLDVAKQYINRAKKEYEQLRKQKDDMFQKMLDSMPEDTGLDAQGNLDDKLMTEAEKLFNEKYAEATSEITKRMQELETKFGKNIGTSQYDAYRNFAGEIEAREVQNRMNMTAKERREKLPNLGGDEAIVKFSMKEPVETTKDLIAAHNLTIDNMMKTLDLGGLPAASIAVAKADMGHSEFGEISVLFYPDTIDGKKNKANKVFAGDAWTQTFPRMSKKVSKQAHERLEKRINSLLAGDDNYKDLGYLNLSYDGVQGEIDRWDSFERAYSNSYLMKLAYLRDTGKEFKPVMMEKNFIEDKPVMKAMLQIIGADKAKEWMDKDEMMSYEPQIRQALNKYYSTITLDTERYDEPMTLREIDRIFDSLRKYASYVENGSPKVVDTRKTEAKFDKAVNMKAYTKWLESISEGLIEKQGVRNSKDPYTNNGRRTWDQLYDEPTLENITKAMTSKDLTGNSFSGGTRFAAGVKKQLGSISDIKKNKDLIKDVSDEEIKAIRDDIDRRLIELVDKVRSDDSDSLFARDGVIDSLLDAALKGKTRDGIKRRLIATQYGSIDKSKLTDKVVDDFVQLIQDAQAVPTRYFEAKPQRAIGLDEIAMVVIPRKGTKELRAALDARGISYKMYDGTAEDRIAKINGVPDVKFSLKKADAKNIARKIKADYGSKSTIKDIAQELTEIYDMDVNDMMAVNQRIEDLAARIAENVPTVNEFEQRIKEFRRYVRNMPIRLDDNIKADIADFGAWSKRYFNRLNLSADGRNIDELYGSLAEQFPEFLESDIDNPTDQLMAIAEALDTTRKDKGYSNNEDMMYDILLDIYDDYYRYQADEQAKAAEGPEMEPGDDGPGNNGPTDDGDAYGDYDGDTSLARIDVWEHTEPEDRSPYFEKGENPARDINVPQRDEYGRKVSRFTRTAAESRALDDNQASELNESVWNGTFSYNVITDQDAINRANDKMERFDNDTLLNGLESKLYDSKIITKDDIALGERLIQEYAKEKDTENLERAIAVVATAGTRAGQAVQAMRLLKKLSPAGQLMALQKQIDSINTDMKLLGDKKVTLSPERAKDITSSDTPEGLEQAVERAKMELYNKVPSRWVDKWNAWRYLSMLGNPKTHIRNVFSNVIFVPVKGMKNVIGATIEAATVKGERSKAIGKLPKVFKEFAAKEFDENKEAIDAGGKENIERNKRVFKSSLLEGMRKANSFALEAEDQKFLKAAYVRSFAGYLKANKISPALVQKLMSGKGTDIEIGDAATAKIFNNARAYAMNEAQKATYRDYSALANALNKFKKTNAVTAVLGEGLMPFTKTPINILKRGVEYSPVGILKGIKELANDVRKADDDMKQQVILKGIDSMASGLSGSAILALGAFFASQGILSGGGEEEKKERDMAAMMGSQNYSFNMGDVSYTVDWMAPVSLPLFVGVELFNSLESGTVNGFVDIVDAMTSISEPMVNMSMLQGLNRAVTNYDQKGALTSTAADMALGYFSQGVPTLGGQIARTSDNTRRTAYVDKNNDIPDTLERPMLNAAAKVPGLSKKLNPYRDAFGRPQTNDSTLMRAFENFISPGYVKVKKNDMVLNELQKVYGRTGEKGVLPSLPNKKIGERDLTAKEYDRMAYIKGKQSYDLINTMRKSDAYKDLSAADQAKMISDAYSYAYAMAKDDVLGVKPDGWIAKAAEAEKKHDIPVETYITYNNYKNSLEGAGTKAKFIDKIQSDESLTQNQKDKLDDYWYGSVEASKITELSNAEQRQWNVAKNYGFDEEKFSKYVGYITQQGEGKTKMNNINDAVKAGLPRGEAVLLYNIMRKKAYRYNG